MQAGLKCDEVPRNATIRPRFDPYPRSRLAEKSPAAQPYKPGKADAAEPRFRPRKACQIASQALKAGRARDPDGGQRRSLLFPGQSGCPPRWLADPADLTP